MDVNDKINWQPGMRLSSNTFNRWEDIQDLRLRMALRAALGGNRLGLLNGEDFICDGMFVKNTFEIERLRCLAVLPSGNIIDTDESVVVTIPILYGNEYFLTIGLGDGGTTFERDDVPLKRTQYVYNINTTEEVEAGDLMPVVRFEVRSGKLELDNDFIPPCLLFNSDSRLDNYREKFAQQLTTLGTHANMEDGDGKRSMMHYAFLLKGFNKQASALKFVQLTQEIAQAVNYYIVIPHSTEEKEIPYPSQIDVSAWLKWLEEYLVGASKILDGVVIEDNSIDYEALLAQAKKELHEQLRPELLAELIEKAKEQLGIELKEYINGTTKPEVSTEMENAVNDKFGIMDGTFNDKFRQQDAAIKGTMFGEVYDKLYDALYNALYVPEEKEDVFTPKI